MNQTRKRELAQEMQTLAQRFWNAEAEICRQFWSVPRSPAEQTPWLRLQVYKEMHGSGLSANPGGIIQGLIHKLDRNLPLAQTQQQRRNLERDIQVLREEFTHYRLFADILEEATGEPVRIQNLPQWQLPQDAELQRIRQQARQQHGHIGEAAIAFTEGGGAAFFQEGRNISGDPLSQRIADACAIVYNDETEHGQHGAAQFQHNLHTEQEWAQARALVIDICRQRLRMRYEMFALPINETRINQIANAQTNPSPQSPPSP